MVCGQPKLMKTPRGAASLVRLFGARSHFQPADVGVGCGPGGPPHLASSTERYHDRPSFHAGGSAPLRSRLGLRCAVPGALRFFHAAANVPSGNGSRASSADRIRGR